MQSLNFAQQQLHQTVTQLSSDMNIRACYWSKPSTKCRTTLSRISRTSSAVSLSRVSGERARLRRSKVVCSYRNGDTSQSQGFISLIDSSFAYQTTPTSQAAPTAQGQGYGYGQGQAQGQLSRDIGLGLGLGHAHLSGHGHCLGLGHVTCHAHVRVRVSVLV